MLTICDTNILLFWADRKDRLTITAQEALENRLVEGNLACSSISFWEIALLFRKNRFTDHLANTEKIKSSFFNQLRNVRFYQFWLTYQPKHQS